MFGAMVRWLCPDPLEVHKREGKKGGFKEGVS